MVRFEALNALYGDCLLLRYGEAAEKIWLIDGGPKAERVGANSVAVWKDVLLARLDEISKVKPLPIVLGMVSHIDDDHINGMQRLTASLVAAKPGRPPAVKFDCFWFNSFDDLLGPKPPGAHAEVAAVATASLVQDLLPHVEDEDAQLVMQSVPQGINLASDLRALGLNGNKPVRGLVVAKKGQGSFPVAGAQVTIVGPLQSRLDKLREAWAKALSKPTKAARQAAMQELFLPEKSLDKSVPNLSSIVVLVEVDDRKLLLTGDAHGGDIVEAWKELGLGDRPKVDLIKMPHHGSIRNTPERFVTFFEADHYVFSANGKYENPDPPVIEAVVKFHGHRRITLHFTNTDIVWSEGYALDKNGTEVRNLEQMLAALHTAYPGPWTARTRAPEDKSIIVELP